MRARKGRLGRAWRRIRDAFQTGGLSEVLRVVSGYLQWQVGGRPLSPMPQVPSIDDWIAAHAKLRPGLSVDNGSFISVICPVYNTEPRMLREAVESVVDQTYGNWELLLVDDASNDLQTLDMLDELAASDDRIRLVANQENLGIAGATNRGIEQALGEYVAFLDHDDLLAPTALEWCASCTPEADLIYSDEAKVDEEGLHHSPFFKPSWSPRLLLGVNYLNHLVCVRTSRLREIGGLRSGFDGAQDHDLLLRLSELSLTVAHIPNILYHWRAWSGSTARAGSSKVEAEAAGRKAVREAIERRGWDAHAGLGRGAPFNYRVKWLQRDESPLVKVVLPTRDKVDLLTEVVDGLLKRTDGVRLHLVIVDNGSAKEATLDYLSSLASRDDVTVVPVDDAFNYSLLCNAGAEAGPEAPFILLLNNDVEIVHRKWLQQMVGWMADPDILAVGAKLMFPDRTIQHAGVVLGMGGVAGHYAHRMPDEPLLGSLHDQTREIGCLTAACLLVRSSAYWKVGGLDEDLSVDFQDVDFCLRLREELGGTLLYEATYPLNHIESASRGLEDASSGYTVARLRFIWSEVIDRGDPYYNPHLALDRHDMAMRRIATTADDRLRRLSPRWTVTAGP